MPRPWSDYSLREWGRLRPFLHALKTQRYRRIDAAYRRRPATAGDVAAIARTIAGRNVLITIAFADVESIRWQIALVRHYVPTAVHVIVDNSPDPTVGARIRQVASETGTPYLHLPPNPWTGKEPSRSHGAALNWTWHNLVRAGKPAAFGFIDDDLFPTAPDDPFAPLATHKICGPVRRVEPRWFLWAGFCVFRYDAVADVRLDFGQDWFVGLDTGGANWDPLYSRLAPADLCEIESRWVAFKPGIDWKDGPLQWCGTWLHEVGLMGRPDLFEEKRATVVALIAPHLAAATARTPAPAVPD